MTLGAKLKDQSGYFAKGKRKSGSRERKEKREGASPRFEATVASARWCTRNEEKGNKEGTAIDFGVGTAKSPGKDWSSAIEKFEIILASDLL